MATKKAPTEQIAPTQEEFDAMRARLEEATAQLARYQGRTVKIKSPAGPTHVFRGFNDAGGDLVITGLPEDDLGHWDPYYGLTVNGHELGRAEIVVDGGA